MNFTTIEQSLKLVELGLNPNTADLYWELLNENPNRYGIYCFPYDKNNCYHNMEELKKQYKDCKFIPCWSVGCLLDMLPKCFYSDTYKSNVNFELYKYDNNNTQYILNYTSDNKILLRASGNLIAVLYNAVCWLLKQELPL